MIKRLLFYLRKSDWGLSLIVIFLTAFGLMAIYSIEAASTSRDFLNFKKQLIFFGVGLILMLLISVSDYRYFRTYSFVLYGLGIALLLAVLFFGSTVRGTRGWFYFFGQQGFQPVELIKIILIVILSKFFSGWRAEVMTWQNLLKIIAVALPLIALVILQPDFGSAFILLAIFLGLLLLIKIKKSYVIGIVVIILIVITVSWLFVLKDYQKERVLTFLNPSRDPYGSGYNIKQSIIAVGSGNFFGRGLSLGSQSRLNFLPVQQTDFIFAVIAEELGFVGAGLVLIFFITLLYRIISIARKARDDFGLLLTAGVAVYLAVQGIMNIGMNIGLIPVAGVPLPFVSYGGSALIGCFIAIGLVQSVKIRQSTA